MCGERLRALMAAAVIAWSAAALGAPSSVTLFHNNDGESKLRARSSFGGFDFFLGELEAARAAASSAGRDVLTISSGDNFLAGLVFNTSRERVGAEPAGSADPTRQNYYDALALAAAGYDAITLGNHEFDFGPETLADFIVGYRHAGGGAVFLSSNLDFSAEPSLASLVASGAIARSVVVTGASGEAYGIIGVTTPSLGAISSPGRVAASGLRLEDVAEAVNAEVSALEAAGVDRIILSGHLQALSEDQALVPLLSGVDLIIAGGSDALLRNGDDANTSAPFGPTIDGPYPTLSAATDRDGKTIALVTTQGEYRYVGRLEVEFDANGEVSSVGGASPNPILVDEEVSPRALGVFNGIDVQNDIMEPLSAEVAGLEAQVIGSTNVNLDGRRTRVRTTETNLGSLVADAFVFQARELGGLGGDPLIAVINGGGIRNDGVIGPGNLTVADILDVLPFANTLVVVNDLGVGVLVEALEHAVSQLPEPYGGFLQVAGFSFAFAEDTKAILRVELADGTLLYTRELGDVFGGTLDLVTNDFTAAGGDEFDEFASFTPVGLGVSDADALLTYIENGLGGVVDAAVYPEGGLGRITAVEAQAAALRGSREKGREKGTHQFSRRWETSASPFFCSSCRFYAGRDLRPVGLSPPPRPPRAWPSL